MSARYGWYGDDFTGATDTLATLAERGLRALLFLREPTAEQRAAAGPLDAIGIAGASRAMAPDAIAAELDAVGRFFAGEGVSVLHYKCCSTFDSAPHVGSIGAAVAALKPHLPNPLVPVIGGQPNLGRYCLFGNLFAAAGSGGAVHRIDRHPTMSVHPVTPMAEADLRRHLAAQGLHDMALVDYRAHGEATLPNLPGPEAGPVLFDVSCEEDLAAIGALLAPRLAAGPMLAVGASSVARIFAPLWAEAAGVPSPPPARPGPVLALVGSLSPVTRAQVEAATGWHRIKVDPVRLRADPGHAAALAHEAVARLAGGRVMLVTEAPGGAPAESAAVAAATAALLRATLADVGLSRLVIAGGDTSTMAVKALDIWGLAYKAPMVPGAPLCAARSDDPRLDGLELVLKGGQMGPPDFFALAAG